MSEGDISGASRPTRRLIGASLVAWVVLALALPLAALTLNAVKISGVPLGFWIAAQGALIGLAALALVFAWRAGGARTGEGARPALVFGAEALGSVAIAGAAGAVISLGYDGLPVALGIVAGMALMTVLVAPRFVLYPVQSIGGYFSARFGGRWPRRVALIIFTVSAVLLLAADMRGGALAIQALTTAGYVLALAAMVLVTSLAWLARSVLAPRRIAGLSYLAILGGFVAALVGYALHRGAFPIAHVAYGDALQALAAVDQKLIINKLADVASLRPMASPFLKQSMQNFAGILLAVALGLAAAPHLIGRHVSRAAVAPGDAVRRTALATVFVALVVAGIAPLAVNARLGFGETLAAGIESAAMPQAFADASGAGWISVCGDQTAEKTELAAACARMPGQRGFLRLQDLGLPGDSFIVAAPVLSGLPGWAARSLYFALLIAAVVAGQAVLGGMLGIDSEARSAGSRDDVEFDLRSAALGVFLIVAAAIIAGRGRLDIAELATDGLALAAAGLFPAIVLSLYWRRMSAGGALVAMSVGFGIAAAYIAGVRLFPIDLYDATSSLSGAPPAEIHKFDALRQAVESAADPAARETARAAFVAQAAKVANWWGLKPAAIVLVAVPAGILTGMAVSFITPQRDGPRAAS